MKSTIAAQVLALASLANATVFVGIRTRTDGAQSQVAWTNGTPDPCSGFSPIVNSNSNPCGRDFFVDGDNGPFRLEGCGGNGLTLFRTGQFNSNCKYDKQTINCDGGATIEQDWNCA
ncbi:hypothetical protein F5Y10DRAFT_235011 [Nemania abortiva]|nr:hypothetical protein F5Y10DRAFT_235011 [Nemania abortiva]